MKMIKPHVELLTQQYDKLGIYEMVELAGRTSYKSEKNMSFDENGRSTTAEAFTNKLISYNHGAALEHATIYLTVPKTEKLYKGMVKMYKDNKYSRVIEFDGNAYITTNYRVIIENGWTYDLKYLTEPHKLHVKRYSFRITCNRINSQSFMRHRVFSFLQESTRYVTYNGDLEYISPSDWNTYDAETKKLFKDHITASESVYKALLSKGLKAERARDLLPCGIKTEFVMTGFIDDWGKMLKLRLAKGAHPDAQLIAHQISDILNDVIQD